MNANAKKPTRLKGRVHVVRDQKGKPINDIDTDMIFHNAHLAITDVEKMGVHSFGNLPGWDDFPRRVKPGDILVVGGNFGAGSSRQQAVDCFRALGVTAIIGESFGAIYLRNAINSGMPVVRVPGIMDSDLKDGDIIEFDMEQSTLKAVEPAKDLPKPMPFSKVQLDIYLAGSLFKVTDA
ncbi:MAG: 3-isopropylmalate dehydratase [Planctomycetes bacterium]|nr:3-isopropylmalate dehydratase [Planctomycetota bacterium]